MRLKLFPLIAASLFPLLISSRAPASADPAHDALTALEQVLELWRDGRYDELYRMTSGGSDGMESFARKLAAAPRRPACCWEKLQEARVTVKQSRATVTARLGFEESVPGTRFVTKGITLRKENGNWTVSRSEILALAGSGKKRPAYRYLPSQAPSKRPVP